MREYKASANIQAPAEKIWSILAQVSAWPEWNPNSEKVVGQVALCAKSKVFTKLPPGRAFPIKVTELTPPRKMTWSGGMPLGLFKGQRAYTLAPKGDGSVDFVMHEVFSALLPLIGKSIPDMTKACEQSVFGLKIRAEKR